MSLRAGHVGVVERVLDRDLRRVENVSSEGRDLQQGAVLALMEG
jgi:hypothetical protein